MYFSREDRSKLDNIISKLKKQEYSFWFLDPVDVDEYPSYLRIIAKPMDLGTVKKKLRNGQYESIQDVADDLYLIWHNCQTFNDSKTVHL